MALKCRITDLTRPHPAAIMVHFTMIDDATNPETVLIASATVGFQSVLYDGSGNVVAETDTQRRNRLRGEFDNYCQRLMQQTSTGNAKFEMLRTQALGYEYVLV